MFGFFKKKSKNLPSFNILQDYADKDKYFVRTLQWDWLNERMIHLLDNKAPRTITMDEWPQQVYLDANGQKTISEYILWMANQYEPNNIPEVLDETIIDVINNLLKDEKLIVLKEKKTELPYYLDKPISEQKKSKARKMMIEDGYIK